MQLDGLKLHQLYAVRRQWARVGDAAKLAEIDAAIEACIAAIGDGE